MFLEIFGIAGVSLLVCYGVFIYMWGFNVFPDSKTDYERDAEQWVERVLADFPMASRAILELRAKEQIGVLKRAALNDFIQRNNMVRAQEELAQREAKGINSLVLVEAS